MFFCCQFLSFVVVLISVVVFFLLVCVVDELLLIYFFFFKFDGVLSKCQVEVWYVEDVGIFYVVIRVNVWCVEVICKGLIIVCVWIGDVGVWICFKGVYLELFQYDVIVGFEIDEVEYMCLLFVFGEKYVCEWGIWGFWFRKGFVNGFWVMFMYVLM